MNRRPFIQTLAMGTPLVFCKNSNSASETATILLSQSIKPQKLKKGDKITLVTPGGPITESKIERALLNMQNLGLKPVLGKNVRAKKGHTAGTEKVRLEDLHTAFSDTETKAVWAIRGGDGCNQLLPHLDYELIKNNPKILIGFSDITALINAIYRKTGLVGFHGPIGAWEYTNYNLKNLKPLLFEGVSNHTIESLENTKTIVPGIAEGELVGGNLSLLAALAGTGYDNDYTDKIVFIEDVGEKPRRIDRMLTQLKQANNLEKAKGIVLGEFYDCEPSAGENSLSLIDTLKDRLEYLNIPMVYNFPFGHDENLCTLPVGIKVELDATHKKILFKESAVI